jgi:hypothetical protein
MVAAEVFTGDQVCLKKFRNYLTMKKIILTASVIFALFGLVGCQIKRKRIALLGSKMEKRRHVFIDRIKQKFAQP